MSQQDKPSGLEEAASHAAERIVVAPSVRVGARMLDCACGNPNFTSQRPDCPVHSPTREELREEAERRALYVWHAGKVSS